MQGASRAVVRPALALALVLAGCLAPAPAGEPAAPGAPTAPFALASAAFADGEGIPRRHTCDGEDVAPPLAFTGAPAEAVAVALLVRDPDVPTPQTRLREVTHWVVWDARLVDGAATFPEGELPEGAVEGAAWRGPCPPHGSPPHGYVFEAYALAEPLGLAPGASREAFERALDGRVLAEASLVGAYARALPP